MTLEEGRWATESGSRCVEWRGLYRLAKALAGGTIGSKQAADTLPALGHQKYPTQAPMEIEKSPPASSLLHLISAHHHHETARVRAAKGRALPGGRSDLRSSPLTAIPGHRALFFCLYRSTHEKLQGKRKPAHHLCAPQRSQSRLFRYRRALAPRRMWSIFPKVVFRSLMAGAPYYREAVLPRGIFLPRLMFQGRSAKW